MDRPKRGESWPPPKLRQMIDTGQTQLPPADLKAYSLCFKQSILSALVPKF